MAGPHSEIDWNAPYFDEEMGKYVGEQFNSIDIILLGRVTYQMFAGYWPTQGVKESRTIVFVKDIGAHPQKK